MGGEQTGFKPSIRSIFADVQGIYLMKQIIAMVIALVTAHSLWAQSDGLRIKGILQDRHHEPVPYAVVVVRNINDSVITSDFSADDGSFDLTVAEGRYQLEINFMGESNQIIPLTQTRGMLDMGKITVKMPQNQKLDEVIVMSERNQMSLHIDKRVFSVGSDLTAQGASATEALQNIPSVTVDAEGNVSLRGSQSVRILIDGKASGFASSPDALQQLQADMIDKVEVITNASARYEAQGQSGIINIILKKNHNKGLNGSASVRTGYYPDHGMGLNANYRKNKVNLFGSLSLNYREVDGRSSTRQRLQSEDTSFLYYQGYRHVRRKRNVNANIGMDYQLANNHILNASFGIRSGYGNNDYYRTYDNYTVNEEFVQFNKRDENAKELEDMYEGSLGYTMKLGRNGGEWKTQIRGYRDQDYERSQYIETSTAYTDIMNERSKAYVTEQSLIAQSDLQLPFSENGKIETGIREQIRDFNNDFGYGKFIDAVWQNPARFNDRFNYNEKVYAAYIMASNTFGKLSIQAGVRGEYTDVFTKQYSLNNGTKRHYFNFFPSVAFSYKQNDVTTFQLSYSRRIRRPGQWDLMPFMKFGDNREMLIGNPYVNPELTGSYEAGMLNAWGKGSVLTSIYHRRTVNKFDRISYLGTDGIIYIQSMNIATARAYGLEVNGNYNAFNWLRLTTGFNLFKEEISGSYNGQQYSNNNFSWTNRTSLNLTLPQRWRFQLSGNYEAPRVTAQGKRLSQYFMDFGASKDLLKNKATLGFNLTDLFNSRKWRSVTYTDEIQSQTSFQWKQRSFRLVFTYRFNQQKKESENIIESGGGGE